MLEAVRPPRLHLLHLQRLELRVEAGVRRLPTGVQRTDFPRTNHPVQRLGSRVVMAFAQRNAAAVQRLALSFSSPRPRRRRDLPGSRGQRAAPRERSAAVLAVWAGDVFLDRDREAECHRAVRLSLSTQTPRRASRVPSTDAGAPSAPQPRCASRVSISPSGGPDSQEEQKTKNPLYSGRLFRIHLNLNDLPYGSLYR